MAISDPQTPSVGEPPRARQHSPGRSAAGSATQQYRRLTTVARALGNVRSGTYERRRGCRIIRQSRRELDVAMEYEDLGSGDVKPVGALACLPSENAGQGAQLSRRDRLVRVTNELTSREPAIAPIEWRRDGSMPDSSRRQGRSDREDMVRASQSRPRNGQAHRNRPEPHVPI